MPYNASRREHAGNSLMRGGGLNLAVLYWRRKRRTLEFTAGRGARFIHGAGCVARRSARHPLSFAHCRVSSPEQVRRPSKLLCYAIVHDLYTVQCVLPACSAQIIHCPPYHAFARAGGTAQGEIISFDALYYSIL